MRWKRLCLEWSREPDGYYLVRLDCGHAIRVAADVISFHTRTRRWFVCSVCARIARSQGEIPFTSKGR